MDNVQNTIDCTLSRRQHVTSKDLSYLSLLLRKKHNNASSMNFIYNNIYNFIHKHVMAINNNSDNKNYNNIFIDFSKKYRKKIQQSFNKIHVKKYSHKQTLNIINIVSLFNLLAKSK